MSEGISEIINPDVVIFVLIYGSSDVNKMEHDFMDQVDVLSGILAAIIVNFKNKSFVLSVVYF